MIDALRPDDDATLFLLKEEAFVFSGRSQKLFGLNTSAALVWCWLEEGRTVRQIVEELARALKISSRLAQGHVTALLQEWHEGALVIGEEPPPAPVRTREMDELPEPAFHGPIRWPETYFAERCYGLIDARFTVRYETELHESWLHPILRHLETEESGHIDAVLSVIRGEDGHVLVDGAMPRYCVKDPAQMATPMKDMIATVALDNLRYFLNIHAGVVSNGKSCLLLPAAPASGKSTLTARLIHEGFQYFSDELAPLAEDTLDVIPVPLALCLKSTGWDVLTEFFPSIERLSTHFRPDGKYVKYMPPPNVQANLTSSDARPVSCIVFPRYDPNTPTRIEAISKVEALSGLLDQCLVVPQWLDARKVARLVDWISGTDCYRLQVSSLSDAVRLIRQHWR